MTGSSAETRPLAGVCTTTPAVDAVVDVGLAVRHHDHLRARQLLVEKLMQRLRRPFHVNAVGVFSLEPELGQHRLDVPPDRHFDVPRAIVGATEIEIGDRVAQRLVPPSEQREHDRRRQQPQPRGDADERERHIEFGLMRPPVDEREIVHDEQRAVALFRGERKERDRDRRLLVVQDIERVEFGQRRLRTMDRARHILGRVEHAPIRIAEAQRLEPLVLHELFEKRLQIGSRGLRRKARHNALVDGSEHQARAQFDVALRPFVDNDRRHLGHCGDEHRDRRQPEKGVTHRGDAQQRRYAGPQVRPPASGGASRPSPGAGDRRVCASRREPLPCAHRAADRARAPLRLRPEIAGGRSTASPPQRESPRRNQASSRIPLHTTLPPPVDCIYRSKPHRDGRLSRKSEPCPAQ